MKEEANVSISILTTTKWQPSVLQLLPFSNNNVGAKPARYASSTASYLDKNQDRGFPLLAVTRSENPRPRSKSANTPAGGATGIADRTPGKFNPRKLPRASSERHSRGADVANVSSAKANEKRTAKLRARSDYGLSSFNKRPEVVKISVNDINEQILGKSRVQSAVTVDDGLSTVTCSSPGGGFRLRQRDGERPPCFKGAKSPSLPKSALKPGQGRWPNSGLTFWSSAATAPSANSSRGNSATGFAKHGRGESDSAWQTQGEHYYKRDGRRVKLNVNELPRSKTPIADNDPDKLNMQHVIAFLQSSNNGQDAAVLSGRTKDRESPSLIAARAKSGSPAAVVSSSPAKLMAINGVVASGGGRNGLVSLMTDESGAAGTVAVTPGKKNRLCGGEVEEKEAEMVTPHRLTFSKAGSQGQDGAWTGDARGKPGAESLELYRKTRSSGLQYSEYKGQSVAVNPRQGPTSYPDLQDIHIPLSIRKIRDSGHEGDTKPFRLHRFLTLVPNGSGSLLNMPEKGERTAGASPQNRGSNSRGKKAAIRRGSGGDKAKHRTTPSKRAHHHDNSIYFLDVEPFDDRPKSKGDCHSAGKSRPGEDAERLRRDVQRVIRLPRAHYEAESDEEGSPYCTVPAARNRRALTLSAQGRAIKNIISDNNNNTINNNSSNSHKSGFALQRPQTTNPTVNDNHNNTKTGVPALDSAGLTTMEGVDPNTPDMPAHLPPSNQLDPHLHQNFRQISSEETICPTGGAQTSPTRTEPVAAVTFREMLQLRRDPASSPTKDIPKDAAGETGDPVGMTFLTQSPPLVPRAPSESTSAAHRLSPTTSQPSGRTSVSNPETRELSAATSPHREHVKLSLRKEKNRTRERTYMFQVADEHSEGQSSPSPK